MVRSLEQAWWNVKNKYGKAFRTSMVKRLEQVW